MTNPKIGPYGTRTYGANVKHGLGYDALGAPDGHHWGLGSTTLARTTTTAYLASTDLVSSVTYLVGRVAS